MAGPRSLPACLWQDGAHQPRDRMLTAVRGLRAHSSLQLLSAGEAVSLYDLTLLIQTHKSTSSVSKLRCVFSSRESAAVKSLYQPRHRSHLPRCRSLAVSRGPGGVGSPEFPRRALWRSVFARARADLLRARGGSAGRAGPGGSC